VNFGLQSAKKMRQISSTQNQHFWMLIFGALKGRCALKKLTNDTGQSRLANAYPARMGFASTISGHKFSVLWLISSSLQWKSI